MRTNFVIPYLLERMRDSTRTILGQLVSLVGRPTREDIRALCLSDTHGQPLRRRHTTFAQRPAVHMVCRTLRHGHAVARQPIRRLSRPGGAIGVATSASMRFGVAVPPVQQFVGLLHRLRSRCATAGTPPLPPRVAEQGCQRNRRIPLKILLLLVVITGALYDAISRTREAHPESYGSSVHLKSITSVCRACTTTTAGQARTLLVVDAWVFGESRNQEVTRKSRKMKVVP